MADLSQDERKALAFLRDNGPQGVPEIAREVWAQGGNRSADAQRLVWALNAKGCAFRDREAAPTGLLWAITYTGRRVLVREEVA